ncbi:MAG: SH3 domain-containing protein [Planctomycetota bacterium]
MRNTVVLLVVLLVAAAQGGDAPKRQVQVREAHLREQPSFLGKIVRRLPYETEVTVEEQPKGSAWLRVIVVEGGESGWLAQSAVTPKNTTLKAGKGSADARAGRTTRSLAGRGFSEEVERSRREELRGSDVDKGYQTLDALLLRPPYSIDPAEVPAFAREGGLGGER